MSGGQVDGGKGSSDLGAFIVAAIDFGTTFSGYAFSFKHDYDKDPTQVRLVQSFQLGFIFSCYFYSLDYLSYFKFS